MAHIKIKTPAKINLNLKVSKRRPDGFHPIESIMAAINLFDYIDIEAKDINYGMPSKVGHGFNPKCIKISSNSFEIPHNSANIAYKAAELFLKEANIHADINIYIEKNIPVCAGLAGGSTNASGVLWGLNEICGMPLSLGKINAMLETLGSDLNFCLEGGIKLCKGRGEKLSAMEYTSMPVTLIKPLNLKISAKEAYERFDNLPEGVVSNLPNDLEFVLLEHYPQIKYLHDFGFQMSGSGPTFFAKQACLEPEIKQKLAKEYIIIENLNTINHGVCGV